MEAATDLEKKIIEQIEVSTTIIRRSMPFVACLLYQKLDLQVILLSPESLFKLNYNIHFTVMCMEISTCGVILI